MAVQAGHTVPLIGDTIGVYFDRVVGRWSNRKVLAVRHQGIRWTYAEFKERVETTSE
ncbi:MAG TPA: hypothetical protein VE422_21640 [Terriglobia bacterium]|nr:hypothetical protein [Terriglobia bacterium]